MHTHVQKKLNLFFNLFIFGGLKFVVVPQIIWIKASESTNEKKYVSKGENV